MTRDNTAAVNGVKARGYKSIEFEQA